MAKISVMNLTNRWGGIDILWANMKRQTEQDFELVIVDALWKEREEEVKAYINDPRLKYMRQNDKVEGAHTNLAHADNQGFKSCTGELIVCLQDYIWINPRGLETYWIHHQNHPEGILVTGVGDQFYYPSVEMMKDPKGKITVFSEPYTRRPENKCWTDPRRNDKDSFYMCTYPDWELNWASIPNSVIQELGGMDEEYDFHGFAFDNVNIALRAQMLGHNAYIDQTNECMGFNHDGWWPNPLKVAKISPAMFHAERMKETYDGNFPIKLNYLNG